MELLGQIRKKRRQGHALQLPVDQKTALTLARLLFFLGPLLAYTCVELLNNNQPWGEFSPLQVALNLVWYYLIELIFYFVLGQRDRAGKAAVVVTWLIGIINRYAILFRGRTLFPGDLFTFRTALNVAGNYNYMPDLPMVLSALAVIGFVLLVNALPVERGRRTFSWKQFLPALAGAGAFLYVFFGTGAVERAGILPSLWSTQGNGLALNFSLCAKYSRINPPEGYSAAGLQQSTGGLVSDLPAVAAGADGTVRPVNVIVVMNESLADLGAFPNVELNRDCLPFYHSLKENTVKGTAYSSVFGGTTANSEYEFLTGNTVAFLPAATVPYQMYVGGQEASLSQQMKALGYRTVAMHPYYASGWNRVEVYNSFGFDEQHFLEDFTYTQEDMIREFLSDSADYRNVIQRYEEKEPGESLFIFNVTMQNHSGFTGEWTNLPREVWLAGECEGRYPSVDQYLNLAYQSDRALEELVDYFSQVEEPTLICVFGDHQPQVDNDFYDEVLGEEAVYDTQTAQIKQAVPFFLWANYDIEEREGVKLSLNYLSTLLMETANLPLTGYQKFLGRLCELLPVVNTVGFLDGAGNWTAEEHPELLSEAAQQALKDYRGLEYSNLFDKSRRPQDFFFLKEAPAPKSDK
ncbi:LTA synthase family protein [Pseudoflavonifractor sp. 524-17]|uniref:LTA synthase family protein n=1 Tax=Pseudoflavonifractor sp. 524-17 TaxID=2304577 RepID=UPI001379AFCA|nr:LTA synthase family protein [Pseudoflavonifractor sp. 524-17]NCE64536.1 LTA synthase family protein [Pseudoflavonifractor sp. 524-17]